MPQTHPKRLNPAPKKGTGYLFSGRRRAVFVDRDGVINVSPPQGDYVRRPGEFVLTDGAAEAIARLNRAGFVVVVCTNQRGVARGLMSQDDLDAIHAKMTRELAVAGAHLDGIYACTHGEDEDCDCRKPRTGLFTRAAAEHDIDIASSFVVGDTHREIDAAKSLACRGILVTTKDLPDLGEWHRTRTLPEAVEVILETSSEGTD